MDRIFDDFLVGETGPVTSVDDWPRPLKTLAEETSMISADDIRIHCLCQGFDPEYVWKMPCDDDSFAEIESRWHLTAISKPDTHIYRGYSHNSGIATPDWWKPTDLKHISYYACPQVLGGHKGNRFQVAYHAETDTLFVHYWFNF
ncbi:hypothetical protein [Stieleria varia]|nr:hypothetical protein [Stieleria varia]